jgi:H+/Cl- antiporter ClcA
MLTSTYFNCSQIQPFSVSSQPPRSHIRPDTRSDFTAGPRLPLLAGMATVIGVAAACVAAALLWIIGGISNLVYYHRLSVTMAPPAGHALGLWAVLMPVIGGLIIGLMARYGSEKIRGHGIPEAMEAILIGKSHMSARIAVLKPVSSAIAIGTGGPFGAEGPIIMTGAALGSLFAQQFRLSTNERKTLLVAGAAAGMSAVFSAPLAAVLLAVELLLFEWKPSSLVPVALAAVTAAALRVPLIGSGPIFPVTPHAPLGGAGLLFALAVGLMAGGASGGLTWMVYASEDAFAKLPIHWMWWPAIGGLVVGVGGVFEPRTLGIGYDVIRDLLDGRLVGAVVVGIVLAKALIWSISLGSGTSGGVLAPLLFMGGALGALVAGLAPTGDAGVWAAVGMAAMLGGTMRSPLTAVVFLLEITHDFNLLTGLLLACMAAHAVTVMFLRRSILTEKVARRGHHVMREYTVSPFARVHVRDVMTTNVEAMPSVNAGGTQTAAVAYADDLLEEALAKAAESGDPFLPVVEHANPAQLVGVLDTTAISAMWRVMHEEDRL